MTAVNPRAMGLDYAHRPLVEQLDAGARQLEIDVLNDPPSFDAWCMLCWSGRSGYASTGHFNTSGNKDR